MFAWLFLINQLMFNENIKCSTLRWPWTCQMWKMPLHALFILFSDMLLLLSVLLLQLLLFVTFEFLPFAFVGIFIERERARESEWVPKGRTRRVAIIFLFWFFFSCILFAFILYLLFVIFCYFYFLVCFIFSVKFSAVSDLKITTAAPHGLHFSWTWTLKLMLMLMLLIISCLKFLRNSRHKFWIVIIIFWFWNLELGSDLACALRTL